MKFKPQNIKHFKQGIKDLTPEQNVNIQIISTFWATVGLSIAWLSMIYTLFINFEWKIFGFSIMVTAFIPMQIISYRSYKKQLRFMKDQDKMAEELLEAMS